MVSSIFNKILCIIAVLLIGANYVLRTYDKNATNLKSEIAYILLRKQRDPGYDVPDPDSEPAESEATKENEEAASGATKENEEAASGATKENEEDEEDEEETELERIEELECGISDLCSGACDPKLHYIPRNAPDVSQTERTAYCCERIKTCKSMLVDCPAEYDPKVSDGLFRLKPIYADTREEAIEACCGPKGTVRQMIGFHP